MKKMAFLEYVFMFDPGEAWSHLYEFENFLAEALGKIGMEAEVMKTIGGQFGRGIIYIRKKAGIAEVVVPQKGRPQTIKGKLRNFKETKLRTPAKQFKAKKPARKLRGFDKVLRKAGG